MPDLSAELTTGAGDAGKRSVVISEVWTVLKVPEGVGQTLLVYHTFERKVMFVTTVKFAGNEEKKHGVRYIFNITYRQ